MAPAPDKAMTVCFDLDGTLCTNTYGAYDEAEPFPWAIERVNALAEAGHRIIVFTARGTATGLDWRETTQAQLDRWGVRYDELQLGKPSAAVYVDDRAVHTTAWREGDAFAVPGFGVPAPDGRREPLPEPLGLQRTIVVETGRTYDGRPFLADEHIERVLARAEAAGLAELPAAAEIRAALDAALTRAAGDVVFSIALADPVGAGFLDMAGERVHAPQVTLRSVGQAAAGLVDTALIPPRHLAAVAGGRLFGPVEPSPLADWVRRQAPAIGLAVDLDERPAQADEEFAVLAPLGLVHVAGADDVRVRLDAELQEAVRA